VRPWNHGKFTSPRFDSHFAYDASTRTGYFVRSSPQFQGWRIFASRCAGGIWHDPQSPSFAGDGAEADPFITHDGKHLYFISTRSDDGRKQRGLDIWKASRTKTGDWSQPERLPEPVNSAGMEWFPRVTQDGWLYFGSDRPGGMGGTDIYRARSDNTGTWKIEHLGAGINGPGDEYEAEIDRQGSLMVLMADGDLFVSRVDRGRWGSRQRLGPEINTTALEVGPLLSPSGKSLMFSRDTGPPASGEFLVAGPAEGWPPACPPG
jgi:Tol biopolymer transport system component